MTDGQWGSSFHDGFGVLRGRTVSTLCAAGFVAHQQHFQKLLGATGQHVFCFLVAPITNVEHQDLAIESSPHPIVNTSGFLPVMLNIDMYGAG